VITGFAGATEVASATMAYDELNRMTSYSGPEGTETFAYRGAEWHRHSQTHGGATTGFFYDGDNVAADVVAGGVERTYVTPFPDQTLSFTVVGGETYYYSHDGLGSVRTVTEGDGDVANRYDYLPFGKAYDAGTSVGVKQRYTYTGREDTPTSGLMCYRYRSYAPSVATFAARDRVMRARNL
jgi:RHS repeat-associated protein